MSDAEVRMLVFGCLGSIAVELVNIVRAYEDGKQLSVRYRRPGYLIARFLLCGVAGVLAMAYNTRQDLLSFHIGAATPAIIQLLSARVPNEAASPPP